MKIVAHSIVPPSQPPYQHLGYVSAAPTNELVPPLILTLILLVFALHFWKTKWVLSVFFILLTIAGIVISIASYNNGKQHLAKAMTSIRAQNFLSAYAPDNMGGKEGAEYEQFKKTKKLPSTMV
ncbi:MAG: hypothetical protein WCJ56_15570, partial [bacterium]